MLALALALALMVGACVGWSAAMIVSRPQRRCTHPLARPGPHRRVPVCASCGADVDVRGAV